MSELEKPKKLIEAHLEFLDDLRDSGETNMFGAAPYLMNEFIDLERADAKAITVYWMKTFSQRKAALEQSK
jgi:uncharacterized protein YciI